MSAPTTSTASLMLHSLFGVKGKRILVTGGGSGLGSYMALGFAINGAKVYIVGRREEKLRQVVNDFDQRKKEAGSDGSISYIAGDLSSKEGIKKIVEAYEAKEPYLDVLVSNAGILRDGPHKDVDKNDKDNIQKALWDDEWDSWSDTLNVNTTSVFFTSVAFTPALSRASPQTMREAGPCIIVTTSIAAWSKSRDLPASHSYGVSKLGAEKVANVLNARLMPFKIRVNTLAPGLFPSEMTAATPEAMAEKLGDGMKRIPMERPGSCEDIAGAALFLASRAGAYLSGATLTIDGGRLQIMSAA
ncbi:short chain dehydrogenase [Violaceomyces palustris]|uniref:Short chain dehydrogenase n=1 Tax=Violaceomyces palustris TaxID=1673888 RepID=A0ACD0NQD1_9BASI|nr:short chain dehydrogenase [Violaceomyces palustris]